ncbi:TonB-dependent receptor [Novosphingobium kaempferiae]|uniref:TonB-dependent receptor n=1 Tax=Novosphingobium kaempferiae TaxID=2896849 RepID=UPI001E3C108E|nr:TonB-dependent receptor [Novosphingobium kaempferiae]
MSIAGWLAIHCGALGYGASAFAQSAEEPRDDIVVTATRQQTRLQDTPLAISAYTADQIERSGTRDLRDIVTFTPGLTMGTNEGQGAVPISIRGVGQNDLGIGADAPIAVYLDGVYLARSYMNLFDLVDVERIEVLRGPQGTLYGRNATGGAINVITRAPSDTFEYEGFARYGNYDAWGVQALVSGPLAPALSGKLAIGASRHDGYTRLVPTGEDLDPEKSLTIRGALRWQPTTDLDIRLDADGGFHDMAAIVHNSSAPDFDPKRIAVDAGPREDRDFWGLALTAVHRLSDFELTSITGYREAKLFNVIDTDASAANLIRYEQHDNTSQFSQELRISTVGERRLQWLGGLYYFREAAHTFNPIYLDFTAVPGVASPTMQYITASNRTEAFAAFGQATFHISDKLDINGGLRWSTETKRFNFLQQFSVDLPPLFNSYPQSRQKTTWSNLSPRVGIDYRPNRDLLLYASYSEGFKSGGSTSVSLITQPAPNVFEPETLKAFEGGIKSEWLDGRLRVNATAFHYNYRNLQVRTGDAFGFLIVRNAATATIDGAEFEVNARPTPRMELTAVAALLDARYDRFIDPVSLIDYAGDRLNRAPDVKLGLGAQNRFPLPGIGELLVRGEYEYMSRIYHQPGEMRAFSRDPTNLFNARLALTGNDRHWSVALFGKNLTNERYIGHAFVVLGTPRATITPPRTVGIEFRLSN